jgi:uncharacterized membrane protein YeaQ/YmgE (transglycosylase-associated protein family)
MSVIFLIIVGAAAGFLATRFMNLNLGGVETVAFGIAGALVGGFALRFLIVIGGLLAGLVGAVLGAMALIWLWQTYIKR